jgi:hypothetical protein
LSDRQQEKADLPISRTLEFGSNANVEREMHQEKHFAPIISTDEGIQIDFSEEHRENAYSQIRTSLEFGSNITVSRAWQE